MPGLTRHPVVFVKVWTPDQCPPVAGVCELPILGCHVGDLGVQWREIGSKTSLEGYL
jgi:hypothetical protein